VLRLSQFAVLSVEEVALLEALCVNEERFAARVDIIAEGDAPRPAFVLTHGLACRYRILRNGRRQILTFLVPGDTSDLHGFLITTTDHSISTLMPSRIATIQWEIAIGIAAEHPRLRAALGWSALQEDAIMRERMVSLGRRSARGRTAYLLCELVWRQRAAGLSEDHAIRLPLTQIDLGDALGLTPVAVNRALQDFRRNGWITLERRRLALLAIERLMEIAQFNQDYLHLDGGSQQIRRYFDRLGRVGA
jgi:CRP-like cAMP-binding protein